MLQTLVSILHFGCCVLLIVVILLQQGRGGGLAALGGGSTQVFGGRGAGDLLTRTTAILSVIFMTTNISLAYLGSSGDRALRDRSEALEKSNDEKRVAKEKEKEKATPVPSGVQTAAPDTPAPTPTTNP